MGLAGRKNKQRIGADPRNLTWADDAAKFGQAYLSKFGWDSSQGLGVNGDGMKSHIKVEHKLNLLGIGADVKQGDVAWKQNRDYESLLKRLNTAGAEDNQEDAAREGSQIAAIDVSKDAPEAVPAGTEDDGKSARKRKRKEKAAEDGMKKKKRRTDEEATPEGLVGDSQREAQSVEGQKEKKKSKKRKQAAEAEPEATEKLTPMASSSSTIAGPPVLPRPMAHRARHLKSKRMAHMSGAALDEILGVSSSNASPSATPLTRMSPGADRSTDSQPVLSENLLTTSKKSVADYFKAKLAAKASGSSTPIPSAPPPLSSDPPQGAAADEEARPRVGLGMRAASSFLSSFMSQTTNLETGSEQYTPSPGVIDPQDVCNLEGTNLEPCATLHEEDISPRREKKEKKDKKWRKGGELPPSSTSTGETADTPMNSSSAQPGDQITAIPKNVPASNQRRLEKQKEKEKKRKAKDSS